MICVPDNHAIVHADTCMHAMVFTKLIICYHSHHQQQITCVENIESKQTSNWCLFIYIAIMLILL